MAFTNKGGHGKINEIMQVTEAGVVCCHGAAESSICGNQHICPTHHVEQVRTLLALNCGRDMSPQQH